MSDNFFKRLFGGKTRHSKIVRKDEIVVKKDEMNAINECYNTLKDNILFMSGENKPQVIQFESSVEGEGKTTVCANLAVSLSFNEKRILVVDLDFRRPRINRFFSLSNEVGLVDYMSDKAKIEEVIKHTEYAGLDIITRGSEIFNPSLLLTSEKFAKLISSLREKYDYIFLDSAPVLQVSEYIHISKVSDGVLFVVAYGKAQKKEIHEASELLKRSGARVLGSVMNFYKSGSGGYYGNKYYYYGEEK